MKGFRKILTDLKKSGHIMNDAVFLHSERHSCLLNIELKGCN